MYITCPNCQTKFIVTSNQIGINGRRVKCSKCNYLWYQKLDYNTSKLNDFKDKVNTETIKNHYNTNVPVILPYIPPKKKYNIFPILWTNFIIFCLVILLVDSFKFLGKYDQLKIEAINLGKSRHIDGMKIFYKLYNESDYLISDPIIKVRVMDTNNQALDEYISITKLQTKIAAKQAIYLEMNIDGIPVTAKYIDIAIGNRLGLLFK
ncbi:MJ0042-type zinc finger domain-containing protein [Rickettsia oklahomensis]|uniref:MJ0042-type zinc finger domain-containing protein n=1 Tax=Rickettsia oklahomensis TaxID=3141789 RepID=A0AAU7C021_9RICK